MEQKKKKIAAALAAVTAFIKSEQETRMAAAPYSGQGVTTIEKIIIKEINPWGTSGRQAQMQMRNLMQMKSFHGAKIK